MRHFLIPFLSVFTIAEERVLMWMNEKRSSFGCRLAESKNPNFTSTIYLWRALEREFLKYTIPLQFSVNMIRYLNKRRKHGTGTAQIKTANRINPQQLLTRDCKDSHSPDCCMYCTVILFFRTKTDSSIMLRNTLLRGKEDLLARWRAVAKT
jgi:hypothetical protein